MPSRINTATRPAFTALCVCVSIGVNLKTRGCHTSIVSVSGDIDLHLSVGAPCKHKTWFRMTDPTYHTLGPGSGGQDANLPLPGRGVLVTRKMQLKSFLGVTKKSKRTAERWVPHLMPTYVTPKDFICIFLVTGTPSPGRRLASGVQVWHPALRDSFALLRYSQGL